VKVLICVTGMPGAGKTLVSRAIASALGTPLISMGDVVRDEAVARGYSLDLRSMMKFAKELRKELGKAAVAELVLRRLNTITNPVVVVDGVRSIYEVERFRRNAMVIVVAVHASPKERFRRLKSRGRRDDPKTWSEFARRDMEELELGLGNVIALADIMLVNEGMDLSSIKSEALRRVKEEVRNVLAKG